MLGMGKTFSSRRIRKNIKRHSRDLKRLHMV